MTKIERGAQAIYDTEPFMSSVWHPKVSVFVGTAIPWADVHESQKERFRMKARAVIYAMRGPTDAMLIAGATSRTSPDRFNNGDDTLGPDFDAMIEAALQENAQ